MPRSRMKVRFRLIRLRNSQPLLLKNALGELVGQELLADVNAAAGPVLTLVNRIRPIRDRRRANSRVQRPAHRRVDLQRSLSPIQALEGVGAVLGGSLRFPSNVRERGRILLKLAIGFILPDLLLYFSRPPRGTRRWYYPRETAKGLADVVRFAVSLGRARP